MWKQLLLTLTLTIFTTTCNIKPQYNKLSELNPQINNTILNNQTLKLVFNDGQFFLWKKLIV